MLVAEFGDDSTMDVLTDGERLVEEIVSMRKAA